MLSLLKVNCGEQMWNKGQKLMTAFKSTCKHKHAF